MTPDTAYRQRRLAQGLCTHCPGKPYRGSRRCLACLRVDAATARERARKRREERKSAA
jgi:hypothetical protein